MNTRTILYVDDDVDDFELFSEIVHELDDEVKVIYVNDVCEIDDFLTPLSPDIIVLDMNMPKMNGIDCLKKIRARKGLQKIPVVMCSVMAGKMDEAYKYGANDFILKEGSLDKMKENVRKILQLLSAKKDR